jgi:zinc protease
VTVAATVRRVLDNRLTVLVRPAHHAPVGTFWMWYRVGSRNETTGRTGLSHWVEHMLFKGSAAFPAGSADRLVAREGGINNGLTWLDWTAYTTTLPADRIDLALDVEADRMTGAIFDPDEVASERAVVLAEREGHENSPMFLLLEEVQTSAIKVHPYRHEIVGWRDDIAAIGRDDLYGHYRRHYHPANAVAVVVGPYDPDDLVARVAARFGHIPAGEPPAPLHVVEPPQRGERRVVVRGPDPTAYVVVAWPAPAAADPDYFAFHLLATVLGGAESMNLFGGDPPNRSSRLYRAIVDTGLGTAVSSDLVATIDPFLFTVSAVVRHDRTGADVEDAILGEVARVCDAPLSSAELERAKKQTRAQFAYSAESVTDLGFWLGFAEMVADQAWLEGHLDRLDAVTVADVQRVACARLDEGRRTVGHYVPEPVPGAVRRPQDDADDAADDDAEDGAGAAEPFARFEAR